MRAKLDLSALDLTANRDRPVQEMSDHELMTSIRPDLVARIAQGNAPEHFSATLAEVDRWLAEHGDDPPGAPSRQRRDPSKKDSP